MNPITPYGIRNIGTAQQGSGPDKPANIAVSAVTPVKADPNNAGPNNTGTVRSSVADLAAQGAPVDEARVASIREAIANGSYVIDTQKLADKMLELDLGIPAN
jgi:negative regulator of flagellin synthesis FlgM